MEWYFILLIVVLSLIILAFLGLIFCAFYVVRLYAKPKRKDYKSSMDFLSQYGVKDFYSFNPKPITIEYRDGLIAHGSIIKNDNESKKWIIICHGWKVNHVYSAKYYHLFLSLGYNIIAMDQRGHYKNKKTVCTMGLKESLDVLDIIKYLKENYGEDIKIGLHGESMGGATVLLTMKYDPDVMFIIADCPYADLKLLSEYSTQKYLHFPACFASFAGAIGKIIYGYNACKVRPIDAIKDKNIPLLLMNGDADQMIPTYHSEMIFNEYKGYKELHWFKGAAHARSIFCHSEEYEKIASNFVKKIELKNNL